MRSHAKQQKKSASQIQESDSSNRDHNTVQDKLAPIAVVDQFLGTQATAQDAIAKTCTPPPTASTISRPLTPASAMPPPALLICSIGNPGSAYAHTLHSAGHTLVSALRVHLGYPSFVKDKALGNGQVSRAPFGGEHEWTLWQSTAFMNESGPGLRKGWETFSRGAGAGGAQPPRLVVVHDELEKPMGSISIKATNGASARGHNGLKSILAMVGKTSFVRVGVGIGRPESRESQDVARFVMRKMNATEREKIERAAEEVAAKLIALGPG